MNRIIYIIIYMMLASPFWGWGQGQSSCSVLELHKAQTSGTYSSREMVKMTDGFSSDPYFRAYVDETMICDMEYQDPIDPNRPVDTGKPVGAIAGVVDVSPTGAATYQIPIFTPPGTAGMEPQISIVYNSQGGNGMLGVGWDIAGLSAITRTGQTFYHDNKAVPVNLDGDDRFVLDGNRLMLHLGKYGVIGAIYATEIGTYSQIASSAAANGDCRFEVTTKDGQTLEYGYTDDSRANIGSNILLWRLNKITDINDNYIKYTYGKSNNGESWIEKIEYTGNDNTNLETYNTITFLYATRKDTATAYISRNKILNTRLLRGIKIENKEAATIYRYDFKYTFDGFHSRLIEIIESYSESSLNSTIVKWGDAPVSTHKQEFTINYTQSYDYNDKEKQVYVGDFNGDGKADYMVIYLEDPYRGGAPSYRIYFSDASDNMVVHKHYSADPGMGEGIFKTLGISVGEYYVKYKKGAYISPPDKDGKQHVFFALAEIKSLNEGTVEHAFYECVFGYDNATQETGFSLINTIKVTCDWKYDIQMHLGDFYGDGTSSYFLTQVQVQDNNGNPVSNAGHSLLSDYTKNIPGNPLTSLFANDGCIGIIVKDVNGDGLSDIIRQSRKYNNINKKWTQTNACSRLYLQDGEFHRFGIGYWTFEYDDTIPEFVMGDFNGDGLQDVLQQSLSSTCWQTITNQGYLDFGDADIDMSFSNFSDSIMLVGDFNGDGRADIFAPKQGKIFFNNGTKNPVEYTLPNFAHQDGYVYQIGDFNGYGKSEIIYTHKDKPTMTLYAISPHEQRYLAQIIMDGFNQKTEFEYKPLTKGGDFYVKGTNTGSGVVNFQGPLYAVSKMKVPNGVGGKTSVSLSYKNAKIHRFGKGFLGFSEITSVNDAGNIKTISEYDYHTTFFNIYLKSVKSMLSSDNSEIQKVTYTNRIHDFGNKIISPYVEKTVKEDLLTETKIVDSLFYDFVNGNLKFQETRYVDVSSGGGGGKSVIENTIYTETATYTYKKRGNSPYECLLTKVETTGKHTDDGSKLYSRYMSYGYDANGNLKRQVKDNDVIAHYMLDSYGLATTKIDTIPDIGVITNNFEYDAMHRFVIKSTNPALGTVKTNYNILGKIKNETDINNLTTSYKYDRLGRLTETHTAEGHVIKNAQHWGIEDPTAPQNTLYYVNIDVPGRPNARTYYDSLRREIRTRTIGADNKNIFVDKVYNAKGQLYSVSDPYYENDAQKHTIYEYDSYGRNNKITYQSLKTGIEYSKKNVTITSPDNSTVTRKYNAHGDLASVSDAGGTVTYKYHCSGQPREITTGGATFRMTYDKFGRQDTLKDPDAGNIIYEYNRAGNLITQKDARGMTTQLQYDQLGRIKQKIMPEATMVYSYVESGNAKGALKSVTGEGNSKIQYEYDKYGHVTKLTETIAGENFITQYAYDQYGNNTLITYPTGFDVKQNFNANGYMTEVRRNDNNGLIWQRGEENALRQPLNYTLGNNKTTSYSYDNYNILWKILTPGVQDYEYWIDGTTGNIDYRFEKNGSVELVSEHFNYDNLSRLTNIETTASTSPVNASISYFSNGNIKTKSDAGYGEYLYHGTKKHAVEQINNPTTVLEQSGAQDISYNSYHKTTQITQENRQLKLEYGPDQQRIRSLYYEDNQLKKTKYFVTSYEKEVNHTTGKTKNTHYISTPYGTVAAYIIENGVGQMYYLYKDHLGSITAITNAAGAVVERRSFDAWGRLRNPDTYLYDDILAMVILDRGYTEHEHLEAFGLINMNGRMYDPIIGRMLSPDPYVQGVGTQGFNRYSYCFNNPLKYTDPSGEFFFVFPFITYSKSGGWGIGLSIVAGIPNQFSVQTGFGYNFGSQDLYGFMGISAFYNSLTFTTSNRNGASIGWSTGVGSFLGLPISTNFLSAGANYNIDHNSWSYGVSAWGWDKDNGWSFNPSVTIIIAPERTTNLLRNQGFNTNNQVFNNFMSDPDMTCQGILDYFGFEGTYDPSINSPGQFNPKDGLISYNEVAFSENYDYLRAVYQEESFHKSDYLTYKSKAPDDIFDLHYFEEWRAQIHMYKNQGLYRNSGFDWVKRIRSYGTQSGIYYFDTVASHTFHPQWWHFIYKIPRKW